MRIRHWSLPAALGLLVLGADIASAVEEPRRIQVNPFTRPDLSTGSAEKGVPEIKETNPAGLVLKGTLVAGSDPMANIGGVILEIGEEVEGYRLVSIGEREVVLEKGGFRKTLMMDDEGADARND